MNSNTVPSIFSVDIIDETNNFSQDDVCDGIVDQANLNEKYQALQLEHENLKSQFIQLQLNSDLKIFKLTDKLLSLEKAIDIKYSIIERMKCDLAELTEKNAGLINNNLRNQLTHSQSSSESTAVRILFNPESIIIQKNKKNKKIYSIVGSEMQGDSSLHSKWY